MKEKLTDAGSTGNGMMGAVAVMPGWVLKGLLTSPKGPWVLTQVFRAGALGAVGQQLVVWVMHQTRESRAFKVNSSSWN